MHFDMQKGNGGSNLNCKRGIGNQLFIYSAGRSLGENLGYDHLIESEIGFLGDSYNATFFE